MQQDYDAPYSILAELKSIRHLMDVKETAQVLGKSENTIYNWHHRNQIPSVPLGGDLAFDPATLIVWLIKKQPALVAAARQLGLRI